MSSTSATRPDQYRSPRCVTGLAGQPGVLPEGGVEDRDRLGQRDRQVEEQRALPGLPGGFDPQLVPAFGGGVRLGGQQPRVHVRGLPAAGGRPAQRGAVGGLALAEQQVVRLRARPPGRARSPAPSRPGPTSGRAAPRRSRWPGCSSRPRPWPGRGPPASRCSPGHSPCSGSRQPPPANPPPAAASRTAHDHQMVHGCEARSRSRLKGGKTADQDQKREADPKRAYRLEVSCPGEGCRLSRVGLQVIVRVRI